MRPRVCTRPLSQLRLLYAVDCVEGTSRLFCRASVAVAEAEGAPLGEAAAAGAQCEMFALLPQCQYRRCCLYCAVQATYAVLASLA